MTGSVGGVEDLVANNQHSTKRRSRVDSLEDGEVECETKSDGMRRGELSNGNIGSGLVSLEGLVGGVLSLVTGSELGEVSVVISHPD